MTAGSDRDLLNQEMDHRCFHADSTSCCSQSPKIRLALVSGYFEPGGLERCMAALVNRLPKEAVEPMVIAFDGECKAAEWIERESVKVISLGKGFPNDPRIAFRLASAFRHHKIDIAHSHNWGSLIETSIASRLCGIPHVHAEHGLEFSQNENGWRGKVKPFLKRRFFRQADALVAIAECVKRRLSDVYGIDSGCITLVPNGVPQPVVVDQQQSYCDVRQRLGLSNDALIAGTVGRIASVKGFDDAIQAFLPIAKKSSQHHMVIVGGGPEIDRLRSLSEQLSIGNQVHFVGHQNDIGFWLSGFDLFFNSSRSEAMNLGILEAMSVGLPVVGMDVGDNAVMIQGHGRCGNVVPQGDVTAFSDALDGILDSPTLSKELGAQSQEIYERHYTVESMTASYLSLYQRILNRHSGKLSLKSVDH